MVDVEARLRLLDEFGEMQHVLSLANPPFELIAPPNVTPQLARIANNAFASLCGKYPDYFPAFVAALPMNDIDATVAEIDRAIKGLGGARRAGVYQCRRQAAEPAGVQADIPAYDRI